MGQKCDVVSVMHERIATIGDAQVEYVLDRASLGVGRVNHILRVHGDELVRDGVPLQEFDVAVRNELDRLFPGIAAEGHEQATFAQTFGGLSWRRATDVARPAHLGSLVAVCPMVTDMCFQATKAGLLPAGVVERCLSEKVLRVRASYLDELDETEKVKAEEFLDQAAERSSALWEGLLSGSGGVSVHAPVANIVYTSDSQEPPTERADAAPPDSSAAESGRRPLNGLHLQKELARLQDCTRLRALEDSLRTQCNWPQLEELRDLRHKAVSHKWLTHCDSRQGSVLAQSDFVINVQRRLGACLLQTDVQCARCQQNLDPQLVHSECCDIPGATRGHYAVVRALMPGLRLADSGASTEPRGLSSTHSRPADILTTAAVPGRSAALDVCIASPNSSMAGADAAESAFRRKLRHYRAVLPELAAAGICYRPLVWTSAGRPPPSRGPNHAVRSWGGGVQEQRAWQCQCIGCKVEARSPHRNTAEACRHDAGRHAVSGCQGHMATHRVHGSSACS